MNSAVTGTGQSEPADLIAIAIKAEEKAAWFYRMLAEMTSEEDSQQTLEQLAADEASHAETLKHLYFEITGHGILEPRTAAAEGEPNLFDFPSSSRRAALAFALKNEIKAAELYESQAADCDDPRRAGIFRQLAETEREHAAYMRLQLDRADKEA
ncbi:MAG: ferritin family protein [Thermoanaerobaculales bacterium]|jgi:rubrerythrin|nr:ferritin family protein [Thermoanaerobaculales bacterium]